MNKLTRIEASIATLENERGAIHKKIQPLNDRLMEIFRELEPLRESAAKLRIQAMGEKLSESDWRTIIKDLASNDRSSSALLRFAERKLHETFDMWHSGYWAATNEAAFKIKIEDAPGYAVSQDKNLAGLKFFTGLYTPHADGWVHYGIFENSLSIGGIYELLVKPDLTELELVITSGSRRRTLQKFSSPERAIDYIAQHHPYGDRKSSGHYDEDDQD